MLTSPVPSSASPRKVGPTQALMDTDNRPIAVDSVAVGVTEAESSKPTRLRPAAASF